MKHIKIPSILITILSNMAILTVISIFYVVCYTQSFNFFFQDDFHLLRFVTIAQDVTVSTSDKLQALWNLHNEHRIVFPRLFVLADYYWQGHLDWKVLNTVASLYYLGIFIFLSLLLKKRSLPLWYSVPIAFLIFQPASFENFFWTISTLQQVGNLFWAMFLFYSIVYFPTRYFWVSILLVIVLTFTHGNGLFSFPVVAILLFLQQRYKQLFIWLGLMVSLAFVYFWGYHNGQNSNIAGSLSNPLRLIGCFGGFWGSFITAISDNHITIFAAIALGLFIFVSLLLVNIKTLYNQVTRIFKGSNKRITEKYFPEDNYFLLACFLFFSITALLVSLSRSWASIEAGLVNRYLHNSIIIFALFYCTLLQYNRPIFQKTIGLLFLVGSLSFNVLSWYQNLHHVLYQKKLNQSEAFNYQVNNVTIGNPKSFNDNIKDVLSQSFSKGISSYPTNILSTTLAHLNTTQISHASVYRLSISADSMLVLDATNTHYLKQLQFINTTLPTQGDTFLIFKSDNNTYLYPMNHRKSGKRNFLLFQPYFMNGFYGSVLIDSFAKGTYQIGVLQCISERLVYHFTPQKIIIP